MTPLSCAAVEAWLASGDDQMVAAEARAGLDAHLAACAACRSLAADLSAIRAAAAALPQRPVPPAVWAGLAAAVAARPSAGRGFSVSTVWLAAAAVLVIAIGAALGPLARDAGRDAAGGGEASVAQVTADLEAAEAHYLRAIDGLERIARTDDPALDPQVAEVLRANLLALDGAIRETRTALRARPDDDIARRGLFEALDGKVALLEQTVSLIDAERVLDDPAAHPQD
jgi:hypothetical protein